MAILGGIHGSTSIDGGVRRCLLAWPALCSRDYVDAVQRNDEQALAIHAQFYAAAWILSPPCDWLFAARSLFMCRVIVDQLGAPWEKYLTFPMSVCMDGVRGMGK